MRIAITGGAGTIGSALCKSYAGAGNIVYAIDTNERALYLLSLDLPIVPVLQDIRDPYFWNAFYDRNAIDLVINCAACKQLPLVEAHPFHAVSVNGFALGAMYREGIKLVHISTDKAVYPVSLYGFTKYIAEEEAKRLGVSFVRLVNVYGSSGSVIEVFERQGKALQPITVTDPHMVRYFTSEIQTVNLIRQVAESGPGLYMQKEPSMRKIYEIAADFAEQYNVPIKVTGARPGEKLIEELTYDDELVDKIEGDLVRYDSPRRLSDDSLEAMAEEINKTDFRKYSMLKTMWKWIPNR